ncbi:MAG TPA: hypothetical protein VF796_10235 [Humisphaera sp.]
MPRKPKALVVLGMLVAAAAAFSYLSAYALVDALVAADIVHRWPPDADPRPRWLAVTFASVLAAALAAGFVFRTVSQRHLRQIDGMGDEAEAQP